MNCHPTIKPEQDNLKNHWLNYFLQKLGFHTPIGGITQCFGFHFRCSALKKNRVTWHK